MTAHFWDRRAVTRTLLATLAASACTDESAGEANPPAPPPILLRRGIGLHMMSWPNVRTHTPLRFEWPPFRTEEHLLSDFEMSTIRYVGFDFVRFPVGPEIFMGVNAERQAEVAALLRRTVQRLRHFDIKVLVNFHPSYNVDAFNAERIVGDQNTFTRYLAALRIAARAVADIDGVVFEVQNEPEVRDANVWRAMLLRMVEAVREVSTTMPIMVCGYDGSGFEELMALDPLPRHLEPLLYTFHHYSPGVFAMQTQFDAVKHITGLEWPPEPSRLNVNLATAERNIAADRELDAAGRAQARETALDVLRTYYARNYDQRRLAADFARVANWADRNGIARGAVVLGEFGVVRTAWEYTGADEPSRLRWLEAVRREAESNGFGWDVWTYSGWGGMALTDFETRAFDAPSLIALGLRPPA